MKDHRLDTNRAGTKLDDRYLKTKGRYCDGAGLYLDVAAPGQGSYLFRFKKAYRSVGSANVYSIAEARKKADEMWQAARRGEDPFALLDHGRARPAGKTFATAMAEYLAVKSPSWLASNRARELRRYEFLFGQIPDFVKLPLKAIDQDAKNKALAPWNGQEKKRSDVKYYINAILAYAIEGKLRIAAGKRPDHQPSMPYQNVPAFYAGLNGTVDAQALRFVILTGARASEVVGGEAKAPANWGEIGEVEGMPMWIIPGGIEGRMKGGRVHHVPLSAQMIALLGPRQADDVPLFKTTNGDALLNTLRKTEPVYTVHGFRTSISNWVLEKTNYGSDLADMCIAHLTTNKVRAAYQRSPQFKKRQAIFREWSDFVTGSGSGS